MLTGLAFQPYRASFRACSRACACASRQRDSRSALVARLARNMLDSTASVRIGSCRLGIPGDGEIRRVIALKVLVIRLGEQVVCPDADHPRVRARPANGVAVHAVAHRIDDAPRIEQLKPQHHIGLGYRAGAL